MNVCVVEKGAEVGAHILSGNVFEPRALRELFPSFLMKDGAEEVFHTKVTNDHFYWLPNEKRSVKVPNLLLPAEMHNEGNYILSLGVMCRWLANQAEELGVEIYPGFAADQPVFGEDGSVVGIQTADVGIGVDGKKKDTYEPGMQLLGKQVVLAEGCRGSLSEAIMEKYNLRAGVSPQAYGLGIKEVWEVDSPHHKPGTVVHSVGWPMAGIMGKNYGGSFIYHMAPNLVHIGMVVGLDYKNPYLSPYQEFQRFKHHPRVAALLEGGNCVSYGARCLNEGGIQAIPKVTFPGGMIVGCSAGFLNVPKIKGSHTALKSGMIAADTISDSKAQWEDSPGQELSSYRSNLEKSWLWDELVKTRNCKPAFKWGLLPGMAYSGASLLVSRGMEPWTFKWTKKDSECTGKAKDYKPIEYPKPDGKLSFDLLENLSRSNVNHEHDQPAHLKVKPEKQAVPVSVSLSEYAGPEGRFCPAKVYEYVNDAEGNPRLQINAQNCVHCKCCSIKTPQEYIRWTVPEGGGGPQYTAM